MRGNRIAIITSAEAMGMARFELIFTEMPMGNNLVVPVGPFTDVLGGRPAGRGWRAGSWSGTSWAPHSQLRPACLPAAAST